MVGTPVKHRHISLLARQAALLQVHQRRDTARRRRVSISTSRLTAPTSRTLSHRRQARLTIKITSRLRVLPQASSNLEATITAVLSLLRQGHTHTDSSQAMGPRNKEEDMRRNTTHQPVHPRLAMAVIPGSNSHMAVSHPMVNRTARTMASRSSSRTVVTHTEMWVRHQEREV